MLLILISCKINPQQQVGNDLKIEIQNSIIEIDIKKPDVEEQIFNLKYRIYNNSEENYAIIIDTTKVFSYSSNFDISNYLQDKNPNRLKQIFQPGIKLKKINIEFDYTDNYFNQLPSLNETIKNYLIVIKPKSYVEYNLRLVYPYTVNNGLGESFSILTYIPKEKSGSLEIFLYQNNKIITDNIDDKLLKELNAKKIKFYNGILSSNEVPLILKK
ncbi:MAG: hypothetical protein KBA33_08860 [Cloacibacterium sp.]|nr:hypothetical protein [Cloacibacterium sp.]